MHKPNNAEAHCKMGNTLQEQGKLDEAIASFHQALELKPDYAEAYYNLGNALQIQGKFSNSIASYNKALTLNPDYAEAQNNMGNALQEQGKIDEAIASFRQALTLKPNFFDAYYNLGNALRGQGKFDVAIDAYRKALTLNPNFAPVHNNMGLALRENDQHEDAIASYRKALTLMPDLAEAHHNMGIALQEQGRVDDAIASYNKALKIDPKHTDANWNLSLAYLLKEDFKNGWPQYEWRWKNNSFQTPPLQTGKPAWKPSVGKRVLLWSEQGIGDEIMFSSIIPEIFSKSKQLIVQIDERLIPLFKRSFPKGIIYYSKRDKVPEDLYDSHLPIGSLPMFFRTELESFKNSSKGWLSACNLETENLRSKLICGDTKTLIGISWHTISKLKGRQIRIIPLQKLTSKLHSYGKKLVSLQYGNVDEEVNNLFTVYGIKVNQVPEIDNMNDIDGLANLISACDKVVSIDNMTIHLAGALGKKSKLLLPYVCNWRWGQSRHTSYWYNSVQIFRQTKNGNWDIALRHLGNVCNL